MQTYYFGKTGDRAVDFASTHALQWYNQLNSIYDDAFNIWISISRLNNTEKKIIN